MKVLITGSDSVLSLGKTSVESSTHQEAFIWQLGARRESGWAGGHWNSCRALKPRLCLQQVTRGKGPGYLWAVLSQCRKARYQGAAKSTGSDERHEPGLPLRVCARVASGRYGWSYQQALSPDLTLLYIFYNRIDTVLYTILTFKIISLFAPSSLRGKPLVPI